MENIKVNFVDMSGNLKTGRRIKIGPVECMIEYIPSEWVSKSRRTDRQSDRQKYMWKDNMYNIDLIVKWILKTQTTVDKRNT